MQFLLSHLKHYQQSDVVSGMMDTDLWGHSIFMNLVTTNFEGVSRMQMIGEFTTERSFFYVFQKKFGNQLYSGSGVQYLSSERGRRNYHRSCCPGAVDSTRARIEVIHRQRRCKVVG